MARGRIARGALVGAAVAQLVLACAASANRIAAPDGDGDPAVCALADPCGIEAAVEQAPASGGGVQVTLLPGAYFLTEELSVPTRMVVSGVNPGSEIDDAERAVIVSWAPVAVSVGDQSTLERVAIGHAGERGALELDHGAEAAYVRAASTAPGTCLLQPGSFLADSVCWNAGGGAAVAMPEPEFLIERADPARLAGVTAVAQGPGARGLEVVSGASCGPAWEGEQPVCFPGGAAQLLVINSIASGETDIRVESREDLGNVLVRIAHSNFDTTEEVRAGRVESGAPETNQTAPPQFADAESGGFRQNPQSPTVDAGSNENWEGRFVLSGIKDVDLQFRVGSSDIGADELGIPVVTPIPPSTSLSSAPEPKTSRRKATFRFGSDDPGATFACSLDSQQFAPCTSPERVRVDRGRHRFRVSALNAIGADMTPATHRWRVQRRD